MAPHPTDAEALDMAVATRRRSLAARVALIGAAMTLAIVSLAGLRIDQARRRELVAEAQRVLAEDTAAEVSHRIRNERSFHHAQLAFARALVYGVVHGDEPGDAGSFVATGSREDDLARLELAHELALRALRAQPDNWLATMLVGGTTYFERQLRHDRRLVEAAGDWQAPMLRAVELAPGQPEPSQLLVAAYLAVWPNLSEDKRRLTRELLAEALRRDPSSLSRLGPAWLSVARDLDEAFAVIPDRPDAWSSLESYYADRRSWDAFLRARARYDDALERQLEADLEEAESRLRLGDHFGGRSVLLRVVSQAPRELRFVPYVTRALERYPAGLHGLASTRRLADWLRWSLELLELGHQPLPPRVIGRLAGAADGLQPPELALAALVSQEVTHAEQLERQTDWLSRPEWADYLVVKAAWHLDREQPDQAWTTLELVARIARRKLSYWLAREKVSRARGDLVELAEARKQVAALQRSEWTALDWRTLGGRAVLEVFAEAPAPGLTVGLVGVPAGGAVVALLWDGRAVARTAVSGSPATSSSSVEVDIEVDEHPHLLELRVLAGGKVQPGTVRLLESAGTGSR